MIFFIWLVLAIAVAVAGDSRKIGFWPALLWSVFLSPIVGAIITFSSPTKRELYLQEQRHQQTLKAASEKKTESVSDELLKLKNLLDTGVITQDDYEAAKRKLLG